MDIHISFALQYYVYDINFISHLTLNMIIWYISNKQGGMKKLRVKFHFNKNEIKD
jgi:hypothetical protein